MLIVFFIFLKNSQKKTIPAAKPQVLFRR